MFVITDFDNQYFPLYEWIPDKPGILFKCRSMFLKFRQPIKQISFVSVIFLFFESNECMW